MRKEITTFIYRITKIWIPYSRKEVIRIEKEKKLFLNVSHHLNRCVILASAIENACTAVNGHSKSSV